MCTCYFVKNLKRSLKINIIKSNTYGQNVFDMNWHDIEQNRYINYLNVMLSNKTSENYSYIAIAVNFELLQASQYFCNLIVFWHCQRELF